MTHAPQDCFLALVPCAGMGARAGGARPKQYEGLMGRMLVQHTLAALARVTRLARILVVTSPGDHTLRDVPGPWEVAGCGGASRAESVFNGLGHLRRTGARDSDWVLVHDAARCLVTPAQVDALIDACRDDAVGGLLALPLADTLKSERGGRSAGTLERLGKWLAQTPQMFRLGALHAALAAHAAGGFAGITDEASAMEMAGLAPRLVRGNRQNIKVTYPEDFSLAEAILRSRAS